MKSWSSGGHAVSTRFPHAHQRWQQGNKGVPRLIRKHTPKALDITGVCMWGRGERGVSPLSGTTRKRADPRNNCSDFPR